MWYGKVSIILYVFSLSFMVSSYYLNQVFNDPLISNSATYQSLNATAHAFTFSPEVNTNFIFGDFITVMTLIGNIMSGGYFETVFGDAGIIHGAGGPADISLSLIMGLLFDSATFFLILYIVSNRSL